MRLREFFLLQKSDRVTIAIIVGFVIAALLVLHFLGEEQDNSMLTDPSRQSAGFTAADSLPSSSRSHGHAESRYDVNDKEAVPATLFDFDPNTADSTQLTRLGLAWWQARSIIRYRKAGGIFRRPEDFARVYGLTAGQYRALAPHIRIGADYRPASETVADGDLPSAFTQPENDSLPYPKKLRIGETISLNTSDTTLLKRVPGIGSYFARVIVNYGERLGGYHSVTQLMEISNFPEPALDFFRADATPLKHLNLNRLSLEQLRKHPYMGFHRARAITDYRRLRGPLTSLDDLRLLPNFTADDIERLRPYVEF